MGKADKSMKAFLEIPEIFSQLFNVAVFGGKEEIKPEDLSETNPVLDAVLELSENELDYVERVRDVVKTSDFGISFRIILGVEEQTDIHYYMPVRDMLMDAISYDSQCRRIASNAKEKGENFQYSNGVPKGTHIMPVISLILYVGSKKWDGPTQLYDMFDIPEDRREWAKQYIRNYPINLIDARHMSEEQINQFQGDLKAFFSVLPNRFNTKNLKGVIAKHRETWYAISTIKKDNPFVEYINSKSDKEIMGGVFMDVTLDYIEAKGKKEGERVGKKEGKREGKREGINITGKLYKILLADNRISDWDKAIEDEGYMMELLDEYALNDKENE